MLTSTDCINLVEFLNRTQLSGKEAPVLVTLVHKIQLTAKKLQDEEAARINANKNVESAKE